MVTSVITRRHQNLRRLYEAAERDRNPNRFFDELRLGFEKKEVKPEDFSVRQLLEQFIDGGREMVATWDPRQGGTGGHNLALLEAAGEVNSAAFSNITGQLVFSAILAAYMSEEFIFKALIPTVSTSLNGEKIPGISELGDAGEDIGEAQPYPTAGVHEDWIETPATKKRGLLVPITKEAIFFDRTGIILQRCGDVGKSIGIRQEKQAIDCIIDENTTIHRYKWRGTTHATYQTSAPWDNVTASNALVDWTDIDNAEQTMNGLLDPNTGEPITVEAEDIIVTKALEQTANRIINATEIEVATPGFAVSANPTVTKIANPYKSKYKVRSSRLLASRLATDTDWFLGSIGKAYRYMENWPLQTQEAPPNSHDEFHRDIVKQFKASRRGEYSTWEPRHMEKSTVA